MPDKDDGSVERIMEEILIYLDRNPRAKDTAEGVLQWWLAQYRYQIAIEKTQQALERLVSEGKLDKTVGATGIPIYSGKHSKGIRLPDDD